MKNKLKNINGFTLIELLIVIAIIGILASVVLVKLTSGKAKARDSRRMADLKQINTAIQAYFSYKGSYPLCPASTGGAYIDNGISDCLSTALISERLASKLPVDPLYGNNGTTAYDYAYYSTDNGMMYGLRTGFELAPLQQNSDYPSGTSCDSGVYPTCGWYSNCVYRGYGAEACSLAQSYGSQ